jgi:hypothetical protein
MIAPLSSRIRARRGAQARALEKQLRWRRRFGTGPPVVRAEGLCVVKAMAFLNPFSELSTDLLKLLFSSHDPLQVRLVCKDMKDKIENSPKFTIRLSPEGTQNASSTFFLRFKGETSIGSRHGWDHQTGWFSSLMDAIHRGLRVDTILPLPVNSLNLSNFCSRLNDVCVSKIRILSITFSGTLRSLSKSMTSLCRLCNVAETIELKVDVLYRRPRELLCGVIEQITGLGGSAISFKALSIR